MTEVAFAEYNKNKPAKIPHGTTASPDSLSTAGQIKFAIGTGRQLTRPYRMNTRISAIATSVYVLVTVMPRYSRSILSSILQGKPRSGGTGAGPYTENGMQYPSLVYSEVNTSSPSAQAESPAPFLPSFPKSKWASLHFNFGH